MDDGLYRVSKYEQKENGCLVTFSDEEQLFFSFDEFYKYSLYDTEVPGTMSLEKLILTVQTERAFSDGLREALKSRKTSGEVRKTLIGLEYPEEAIEEALKSLCEEKYIDDRRYALSFVKKNSEDKMLSLSLIRRLASEKGIPEKETEYAISELGPDDRQTAQRAASKKLAEIMRRTEFSDEQAEEEKFPLKSLPLKEKRKLCSFLASKGFSFEVINDIIHMQNNSEGFGE